MGKGLNYLRSRKLLLPQFVDRLLAGIENRDISVAPRHVVVRVEHDLARELLDGHVVVQLEGHGDHGEVTGPCSFTCECGARERAEFGYQTPQSFRTSRIPYDNLVAACDGCAGDLATHLACADDADRGHK